MFTIPFQLMDILKFLSYYHTYNLQDLLKKTRYEKGKRTIIPVNNLHMSPNLT